MPYVASFSTRGSSGHPIGQQGTLKGDQRSRHILNPRTAAERSVTSKTPVDHGGIYAAALAQTHCSEHEYKESNTDSSLIYSLHSLQNL